MTHIAKVLRAKREREQTAEPARPEPDCRTCDHYRICSMFGAERDACTNGDRHQPLPPVRLWRKT